MADQVHISRDAPGPADKPISEQAHQFGLTAAMALIVGSIIGVGIFNLPTSLAAYGPITLVSMALTTVGALALARSASLSTWDSAATWPSRRPCRPTGEVGRGITLVRVATP